MILALMASGFALVYSISRVANFAHGALYVISAYFTWLFLTKLGLNYFLSIILGVGIIALMGAGIYRFLIARVRGMVLSEMIGSFAIGIGILELVRYWGLKMLVYHLPPYMGGKIDMFGVPVDSHRLVIVGITFLLLICLWVFTHYTKSGLSLRGIAQDEQTATTLGIDSDRAAVMVMAIGSGISGFAGIALVPLGTIAVEAGYEVLIYALAICVLGGLGSWGGALMGAFVVGFAQIITVTLLGSQWQVVIALLAIIAILILRPSGLLGRQKELEERV
jgi:branched-chain amino acid transport system permease protein